MENNRKLKLMDLGPEALADALLNLAVHSDEADDLIEQLIAAPKERLLIFRLQDRLFKSDFDRLLKQLEHKNDKKNED